MKATPLLHLLPTLSIITEELDTLGWHYQANTLNEEQTYRGIRLFYGQKTLSPELIYLVTAEQQEYFPVNTYSYLSTVSLHGRANHICCLEQSAEELLEQLLKMFQRYQELEDAFNQLVLTDASLEELCNLGETVLGNPICIHDDWFIIIAMSKTLPEIMPPESIATSAKRFIPRKFIDSFKYDTDYLNSYSHQQAQLWISSHEPESERCMYVNLWNENLYRGRILIIEQYQTFRPSHFLISECLAQRAMLILNRRESNQSQEYHSMDEIAHSLLEGLLLDPAELTLLLETLHWKKSDQYLCARFQSQRADTTEVLGHVLHSDLFQIFPNSYIMFVKHQQCMILNLNKEQLSIAQVRHYLAPLCRDYCLYAGISSPVWGIQDLKYAFRQADIALEKAFYLHNERWVIPFSTCALDYMMKNIQTDLLPGHLIAPELLALLDYDRAKGTPYFSTLCTFLLQERDISKTSKILIIHRTTLLYRLKKIQSITNLNLEDAQERLYLLLSIHLLKQTHDTQP